jgi:hypothetical protein
MRTDPTGAGTAPSGAAIDLWRERTGEWRWRYDEPENHTRLFSNEDYPNRESAEHAARLSYPGVPIVERSLEVAPGSKTFWLLLAGGGFLLAFALLATLGLIALLMIAIGWRQLRRRTRRRLGQLTRR